MDNEAATLPHPKEERPQKVKLTQAKKVIASGMTEAEAIDRAKAGDAEAFSGLYGLHKRRVYSLCLRMTGNTAEAEDLTQDIFLKIFKSLHTFDRRANFQTWLVSVSRNLCIDHYRSVRKERETIDRDVDAGELTPAAPGQTAYQALEQRDRVDLLRKAMAELPPTLREAVVKRDIQELSYQEIADQLNISVKTVENHMGKALKIMRAQLKDYLPLVLIYLNYWNS
jgi:RNA polymerase sigma-70 factor (ECF subfamily)